MIGAVRDAGWRRSTIRSRSVSRSLRRWLAARLTDCAMVAAPLLTVPTAQRLGQLLAVIGPKLPQLGRHIARNMQAAGLYSPRVHRAHFVELGLHFAGALLALRCAARPNGTAELRAAAGRQVELDRSVDRFAMSVTGRGAILVGPHICNYLLSLAVLADALPLTVYLRHSRDARRRAAKQRWYRASGVRWISEPADAHGPLGRIGAMASELALGRVLFITPDLPQKREHGVAVTWLGRTIHLPGGAALLAERTGAPLCLLTARPVGNRQRLFVSDVYSARPAGRGREARRSAVQARMQWFAEGFEEFVRAAPELWYLWGDKRWTRVLHGDARCGAETVAAAPSVASRGEHR